MHKISRRKFLQYCALSLTTLAFRPITPKVEVDSGRTIRITSRSVSVYDEPDEKSKILYQRYRDELVNTYHDVESPKGPVHNPLWYRVWGGYIHSAHTQVVQQQENSIIYSFPKYGVIAEVTVPISKTVVKDMATKWKDNYRLYYQSIHWIRGVEEGPDGNAWYRIKDELNDAEYYAQASHFRIIPPEEMSPISPEVPPEEKLIEVSLAKQMLWAYEGKNLILESKISSGVPSHFRENGIPTYTPRGDFHVISKMPSKHMGGGQLSDDVNDYIIPGVPWTSFFHEWGVAFHGTYWHNNFGTPMSHGCVNMRTEEAKWIFRWTTPVAEYSDIERRGLGTRVYVS